jgi:hypothetical protein
MAPIGFRERNYEDEISLRTNQLSSHGWHWKADKLGITNVLADGYQNASTLTRLWGRIDSEGFV